jgi:hypothetical protein
MASKNHTPAAARLDVVTDHSAPARDFLPALVRLLRRMRDRQHGAAVAQPAGGKPEDAADLGLARPVTAADQGGTNMDTDR